ncbi:MAG: hypothetical protein U0936_02595 [Planctomycetaceae bacterium]
MSRDARTLRYIAVVAMLAGLSQSLKAATYQTVNFAVTSDRPEVAEQVGKAAELYRRQLAVFWLGKPLPNWSRPCRISVREGALGAGGQTTFQFVRGEVLNWRMQVQGTLERILDSVLPHEVNHTIFACHFRRPLPRWADEGAATLFEHRSEQLKQLALLNEVIRNKNEIISLRDLLSMKEYPQGQRPMLTLYAQGYALADFLVQQKGRHAYLKFIADGERGNWEEAIRTNFDHAGIESLEKNWRGWVLAGMPKLTLPREQMLAANENDADSKAQAASRPELPVSKNAKPPARPRRAPAGEVIRSQSPDTNEFAGADRGVKEPFTATSEPLKTAGSESPTENVDLRLKRDRRVPIVAPMPRRADSRPAVKTPIEPAAEQDSDFFEFLSDSDDSEPRKLEPTASKLTKPAQKGIGPKAAEVSDSEPTEEFEFSGRVLPSERSVTSGSTPSWAGFPGRKKSF